MIACNAGVLLGRANVKARIVYPSGHIWFGVRVDDGGVGGGWRAMRRLLEDEEAVENQKTPWLAALHSISRKKAGNQSKY